MCVETGVGSGTVWEYGKNIFANEEEAARGVIAHQQAMHKERAARDAAVAEEASRRRKIDLLELDRLKAKYDGCTQ
jgi:hypothetical protein